MSDSVIIGRFASGVNCTSVKLEGLGGTRLYPGDAFQLMSPLRERRLGVALVRDYDRYTNTVELGQPLNCHIPAAAEGDYVIAYDPPYTKCRCKDCLNS